MLSDNYYASAACLNEMGAVWMKQKDYYTFLLPDFEFSKIKGAINPSKRGISLWYKSERELQNLKEDLNQFREQMCNLFYIEKQKNWDIIVINLEECEGFCIGEYENRGCSVIYDNIKDKIDSYVDFTRTKAEICSVVIFVGELDVSCEYSIGKK